MSNNNERRLGQRFDHVFPVEVEFDDGLKLKGQTLNISINGALLEIPELEATGSVIGRPGQLKLDSGEEHIQTQFEVARLSQERFAIRFINCKYEASIAIKKLLSD